MTIKSSGLLKWFMIPLVLLAVFVGIKLFSDPKERPAAPPGSAGSSSLTPAEIKALGVEGDTPQDTLATLVAQLKQLRHELNKAVDDNKQQKTENERLRQRESTVDQRIQAALSGDRERSKQERSQSENEQQETRNALQELQRRVDGIKSARDHADLPVGLGLEEGEARPTDDGRIQWTEPQDVNPQQGKGSRSRTVPPQATAGSSIGFESGTDQSELTSEASEGSTERAANRTAEPPSLKPTYTVPANSTLVGSVAMTALIGRVPIDGAVNDPYPFKVLIGPDNLTANGIEVPGVVGAVASGTASGDWTLSCVRGQIRSLTFVFQDGTIRTVSTGAHDTASSTQGGLGWISDPHGIPCVSGERRSNAQQYLTSQMLVTAAGAGAASLIPKGNTNYSYISGSNGNALGTVGISSSEAMGRVLGGGVQEMSQWVNKLYGQAFAAVYVKPAAQVAVHIEQALNIDYDTVGRKVDHRLGETHEPDLD